MPLENDLKDGDRWVFDRAVADSFDDMLERSIPQYETMRKTSSELASRYAQDETWVVDLGCSSGGALEQVMTKRLGRNTYLGVEVSKPMRDAASRRLGDRATILDLDLRGAYPNVEASVVLSVLTLMFVPIEHRQRVVSDAYESLADGGAMIVVEKVLGSGSTLDETFTSMYLAMKSDNGYGPDEITRKRQALEGVLVPVTADWNVDMLKTAGFRYVDCFWRWLNFAGWVAVK